MRAIGHFAGLLLLLVVLVFYPPSWGLGDSFETAKTFFAAFYILLGVGLGIWRRRSAPFQAPLLVIMGWLLLRTAFSVDALSRLDMLASWCTPIMGYLATMGFLPLERRRIRHWLCVAWLVLAGVMAMQAVGIDPLFSFVTESFLTRGERMIGTIGYQNQAATALALLGGAWVFAGKKRGSSPIIIMLTLLLIGLTGCRGAFVGFVAAVSVGQLAQTKRLGENLSWLKPWAVAIIFIAAITAFSGRLSTLFALDSSPGDTWTTRKIFWAVGFALWKEYVLIGTGAGGFRSGYLPGLRDWRNAQPSAVPGDSLEWTEFAHNDFLQLGIEFGWLGILLVVGAIGWGLIQRKKITLSIPSSTCFAAAYFCVHGVFSFPWHMSVAGPLLGWLLASSVAARRPSMASKWSSTMVGLLAVAFFAIRSMQVWENWQTRQPAEGGQVNWDARSRTLPSFCLEGRLYIAAGLLAQNQHDLALRDLERIRHVRENPSGIQLLAEAYFRAGRMGEAEEVLRDWQATGLYPGPAGRTYAKLLEYLGRLNEAVLIRGDLYDRGIDRSLENHVGLLKLKATQGEYAGIREALETYAVFPERRIWQGTRIRFMNGAEQDANVYLSAIWIPFQPAKRLEQIILPVNDSFRIIQIIPRWTDGLGERGVFQHGVNSPRLARSKLDYHLHPDLALDGEGYSLSAEELFNARWHSLSPEFDQWLENYFRTPEEYWFASPLSAQVIPVASRLCEGIWILGTAVCENSLRANAVWQFACEDGLFSFTVSLTDWRQPVSSIPVKQPELMLQLYNLLGVAFMHEQNFVMASHQFKAALAIDPKNVMASENLRRCRVRMDKDI